MRFAGWSKTGLDAKMKFKTASPKPDPTSFGENCWLRDFSHSEYIDEELSCPLFFADWHG